MSSQSRKPTRLHNIVTDEKNKLQMSNSNNATPKRQGNNQHTSNGGTGTPSSSKKKKSPSSRKKKGHEQQQQQQMQVVIHVCDEARGITRDFYCEKNILVEKMHYFKRFFQDLHNVDISVHCDIHVFEWLMSYLRNPNHHEKLETRSAISILIASDFLGMKELVQDTLKFVANHLNKILELPIDLSCLNEKLLQQLLFYLPAEKMFFIQDPEQKLVEKLYRKAVEQILSENAKTLSVCRLCRKVYNGKFVNKLRCPLAMPDVDLHGEMRQIHQPLGRNEFDLIDHYIKPLRGETRESWANIFWSLWGICHIFKCVECGYCFDGASLQTCIVHRSSTGQDGVPKVSPCGTFSVFSCCGTRVPLIKPFISHSVSSMGCRATQHVPDPSFSNRKSIATLKACLENLFLRKPLHIVSTSSEDNDESNNIKNGNESNLLSKSSEWVKRDADGTQRNSFLETFAARGHKAQQVWALESQRDEDVVNMQNLVAYLQKVRR